MTLQEYFRLPNKNRLSRKGLSNKLILEGHSVTPATIGNWIKSNKVPSSWIPLIEPLLNESLKTHYKSDLIIKLNRSKAL